MNTALHMVGRQTKYTKYIFKYIHMSKKLTSLAGGEIRLRAEYMIIKDDGTEKTNDADQY